MKEHLITQNYGSELTPKNVQNVKHLLRKIRGVCIWLVVDADMNFAGYAWEITKITWPKQVQVFAEVMPMSLNLKEQMLEKWKKELDLIEEWENLLIMRPDIMNIWDR